MFATDMLEVYRAFFVDKAPLGDVAILKFAALANDTTRVDTALQDTPARPQHDVKALRRLREGSFGRAYAHFLDDNGIEPLDVRPEMRARFADRPFILRYTQTHDLHHVVLGCDAGLAGEVGVAAFMVGQAREAFRPFYVQALQNAWLVSPSQRAQVRKNFEVGVRLGRQAPLLVAEPLEDWFEEPLEKVRARLGLPETARKDIVASGKSLYLGLVMELADAASTGKQAA